MVPPLAEITVRRKTESFRSHPVSLPQNYFVSPEIFAKERAGIFSKEWLLVGHQSRIRDVGDYVVQQVIGESLIVIRDKTGEIHGFFNVCRHRGTRLKEDTCGHASTIQCPYHAWTYGLDGRLVGAPHMDQVPGFDKADYSLHRSEPRALGGIHFCESWRRLDTARRLQVIGRLVRAVEGKILPLEHAETCAGETDRVRREGQLEVDVRKLFGVLSLPGRASAVAESFALRFGGERSDAKGRFSAGS